MTSFMSDVNSSDKYEITGDVADLLATFTDFVAFKINMIDHRKVSIKCMWSIIFR